MLAPRWLGPTFGRVVPDEARKVMLEDRFERGNRGSENPNIGFDNRP